MTATSARLQALRAARGREEEQEPLVHRQSLVSKVKKKLIDQAVEREEELVSRYTAKPADVPHSAPASARGRGNGDEAVVITTILGNVLPARTWLKSILASPKLRQHVASQHFDKLDRDRRGFIGWPEIQVLTMELYENFGMPAPPNVWLRSAFHDCRADRGPGTPETLTKAEFAVLFEVYLRSAHARVELQREELDREKESFATASDVEWRSMLAATETPLSSSIASFESALLSGDEGSLETNFELGSTPPQESPRQDYELGQGALVRAPQQNAADGKEEVCCADDGDRFMWGSMGTTLMVMCMLFV